MIAVRHTIDIDVYRSGMIRQVEQDLRSAAEVDLGDWVDFEVGRSASVDAAGADSIRLPVSSRIGNTLWARFHVDLVTDGIRMTGLPDARPSRRISSTWLRWSAPWRSGRATNSPPCTVRQIGDSSPCRPSSRFRTPRSGVPGTGPKRNGRAGRYPRRWRRRSMSSNRSSTRCSAPPPPVAGTPDLEAGALELGWPRRRDRCW